MQRLDQLLSSLGYCSRREAKAWVADGRILVAGRAAGDSGARVDPSQVTIDGEPPDHPDGLLIAMNKPAGLVCSHDAREGPSVYDLLPPRWRQRNPAVTSIGRLDKETTGVLLLTDRSELVHRLTSPKQKLPKIYLATLDIEPPVDLPARFAAGTLMLDGEEKPCAPATATLLGPREVEVALTEGRYHQVRRMFAACGCTVVKLHRQRFGNVSADDLQPGAWRGLPLSTFDAR